MKLQHTQRHSAYRLVIYVAAFLVTLIFIATTTTAKTQGCLSIATPMISKGVSSVFVDGIKKALDHSGICYKILLLPVKRIKRRMMDGSIDGEVVRALNYIKSLKGHAIYAPTPLAEAKGFVVTLQGSEFYPSSIADTRGKTIGYVKGLKWQEAIRHRFSQINVSNDYKKLYKMLMIKRIDGMLIDGVTLTSMTRKGEIAPSKIFRSYPIMDLSGYFVLHKKNTHLLKRIDNSIQKLKKQGVFDTRRRKKKVAPAAMDKSKLNF